jgi:SprT protein
MSLILTGSGIILPMIEAIGKTQQSLVIDQSHDYIARAQTIFQRKFAPVEILFDLMGSSAGMFRVRHRHCEIRYNPWLFAKYFDENLASTVPHEVAHYIVHKLHSLGRTRPHGEEWQAVMLAFDAEPTVTGSYDLSGIPRRRQRRFNYRCDCRQHELSTRRHNKITSGSSSYHCRYCRGQLSYQA